MQEKKSDVGIIKIKIDAAALGLDFNRPPAESDAYSVVYNVIFVRTPEAYKAWQIKTYATLQAAWQARHG